jgi:protoporphyrinogen oxidase
MAGRLPQLYKATVTAIDKEAKQVVLSDGQVICYDSLISSMPLDVTLTWLGKQEWAQGLQHSSTHIIGIGVRGSWWVLGQLVNSGFHR